MADIKCSRNTSFAFFVIFFVIFLVSFSSPFWYQLEIEIVNTDVRVVHGLWLTCAYYDLFDDFRVECDSIDDATSDLNGTRALMCLSLLCNIASLVCYSIWVSKDKTYLEENGAGSIGKAALALSLIGGVFTIIAVAIFGSMYSDFNEVLHWAFPMAVVSGAENILNSAITLAVTVCCFQPDTSGRRNSITPSAVQSEPQVNFYSNSSNPTVTVMTTTDPVPKGYPEPPPSHYPVQPAYPGQGSYPQPQNYPPQGNGTQNYPPQQGYGASYEQPPAYQDIENEKNFHM